MNQKQYDAQRIRQQSAKGNLYHKHHPEYNRDRMRLHRQKLQDEGLGNFVDLIEKARNPLSVTIDEPFLVAGDWHIPFTDGDLFTLLLDVADSYEIKKLVVPGDFWDCDNYSKHPVVTHKTTFQSEIENVAMILGILTDTFEEIYFCRGNHEKRWMDLNGGNMTIMDLFATTKINDGYQVTQDDHLYVTHQGEKWLMCHPRNFRIANLSVAKDLAAKHGCSVFAAHGHQWAQGYDRSGKHRLLDGGGMFDKLALEYLRDTSCYPEVKSGFYYFIDGEIYGVEGQ
jgi:hypothetical protein